MPYWSTANTLKSAQWSRQNWRGNEFIDVQMLIMLAIVGTIALSPMSSSMILNTIAHCHHYLLFNLNHFFWEGVYFKSLECRLLSLLNGTSPTITATTTTKKTTKQLNGWDIDADACMKCAIVLRPAIMHVRNKTCCMVFGHDPTRNLFVIAEMKKRVGLDSIPCNSSSHTSTHLIIEKFNSINF